MDFDLASIWAYTQELLFALIVAGTFIGIVFLRGRQTVTNIIFGLYLGVIFTNYFPYKEAIGMEQSWPTAVFVFGLFTALSTWVFSRVLPREYKERMFEGLGRKLLLATGGTVLVLLISFQILPLDEILPADTPLRQLFDQEQYFFWLLLVPIIILLFV